MYKTLLAIILGVGILNFASADSSKLEITDQKQNFVIVKDFDGTPDENGILISQEVVLPAFKRGCYYRPYSSGTPATGNRIEGVAFNSVTALAAYKPSNTRKGHTNVQKGQYILLEIEKGRYLTLLPMVSPDVLSQFYLEDNKLILKTGNFGTEKVKGDLPILIWAYGKSPYEATRLVWKKAIESGYIAADWRINKKYPEMYDYLGWCSWEHYKINISEKIIQDAVKVIEKCGAPIRWIIIDDGYLTHENKRIITFTPDVNKFPNGWKTVTTDLKKPDKVKWIGIWRNMLGYMKAVSPEHTMDDIRKYLVPNAREECFLPDGSKEAAKAFFEKMLQDSKDSGFDFTKVDFQSTAFRHYSGMGNAVRAMRNNNEALEEACIKYDTPLLNCIAQTHVNSFQTKYSALTRTSTDYHQKFKFKNKWSTYQSFANLLWMGQTVWGDLDMFHSHADDAQVMAIARAMSGGPVYVSDEPNKLAPSVLNKFCLEDGKLLRTAAPATLLPDSFFIHPFRGKRPFRVIAPLEDNVAALALFNFTEGGKAVNASFSAIDYTFAGEQMQPYSGAWAQPKDGLIVYDQQEGKVVTLDKKLSYKINTYDGKLFLLYPKVQGWAVIGRTDKYLPAAAVKVKNVSENEIIFTLKESGPLAIWSAKGEPKMDGAAFKSAGNGLYLTDMPIKSGSKEYTVTR